MDIEEEFAVKAQALQMMRERILKEVKELEGKVNDLVHRNDGELEKALGQAQEKLGSLVEVAGMEQDKQVEALNRLNDEVERALQEGEDALRLFEEMKASREGEIQALKREIDNADLAIADQLRAAKKELTSTHEQMLAGIRGETQDRIQMLEEMAQAVRDEYRNST